MHITELHHTAVETDTKESDHAERERCARCGGLMVAEPCVDYWDDAGNATIRRCVQCGDLIDPVILRNRHRMAAR